LDLLSSGDGNEFAVRAQRFVHGTGDGQRATPMPVFDLA
jgi:hypothetical protein